MDKIGLSILPRQHWIPADRLSDARKKMINRRQWLYGIGLMAGAAAQAGTASLAAAEAESKPQRKPLDISEYEPTSMLHVHESRVERSRFPAIDFHTHISF